MASFDLGYLNFITENASNSTSVGDYLLRSVSVDKDMKLSNITATFRKSTRDPVLYRFYALILDGVTREVLYMSNLVEISTPNETDFYKNVNVSIPADYVLEANKKYYIGFYHQSGNHLDYPVRNNNAAKQGTTPSDGMTYTIDKGVFTGRTTPTAGKKLVVNEKSNSSYPYFYLNLKLNNQLPTISLNTTDAQTLYENDTFGIAGNVNDTDIGDVVSVKYRINGGTARAIYGGVSQGNAIAFAKNLTYKSGKLYDGATAVTDALAEGSQHTLEVWGEDDKGGKSPIIIRSFYVVPNRAATLTLDAFVTRTGLINTDVVNIGGKVADLDNGNVIVKYKIGNGAFVQVFNNTVGATPTPFNFNVQLADLADGDNQLTVQAVDAYNAITQQVLNIRKSKNEVPLLEAVTYYEITPPNGTADGLQLYVEREVGDLVVAADVFMGAPGQSEVFVPMTLASTANLTNGNAEDTISYEHGSDATKIVVRVKMTRSSAATNKAIKKISGVLT